MSDVYQATYDAASRAFGRPDVGSALERAFDFSWEKQLVRQAIDNAAYELTRPSAVFRPRLSLDGDRWCAVYGENLQVGVVGFGPSPAEAMAAFDAAWNAKLEAAA